MAPLIVALAACWGQTGLGQEKLPAPPQVSKAEDQDKHPFVLAPETDGHWKWVEYYIERIPHSDYRQASPVLVQPEPHAHLEMAASSHPNQYR